MDSSSFEPVTREQNRNRELRAAVDVMFEALAHVQASMETTSEDKRRDSYRNFKEALYDRFEYLVEKREQSLEDKLGRQSGAQLEENSGARAGEAPEEAPAEETVQTLWPPADPQ